MFLIVGIVMVLPSEETIKPTTSQKDKVLKSQGILLAALQSLASSDIIDTMEEELYGMDDMYERKTITTCGRSVRS